MRNFLLSNAFLLAVFALVACVAASVPSKTLWFQQLVDHSTFSSTPASFKQRVLYTDVYYRKGGPLVFYTGNEGDADSYWDGDGFLFEMAQELGGFLVVAEHRYYGQSLPYGNMSFEPQNLVYLNTEQALNDFAFLIPWLKSSFSLDNSKVIAVGGSYGGMLAAYMRMKFPYIVDAALAASAPIHVFPGMVDPFAFFATVTNDFSQAHNGHLCVDIVRRGLLAVNAASASAAGLAALSDAFHTCAPLQTYADGQQLLYYLQNGFVSLAQGDYPYEVGGVVGNPVNVSCDAALSAAAAHRHPRDDQSLFAALLAAVNVVYNTSQQPIACHDLASNPPCADPTGCGGSVAWDYQACTEMVFPMASNGVTDFFVPQAYNATAYAERCARVYGVRRDDAFMRVQYGGAAALQHTSNIIFSNGLLDPWHGTCEPFSLALFLSTDYVPDCLLQSVAFCRRCPIALSPF